MIRMLRGLVGLLIVLFVGGCGSVPIAVNTENAQADFAAKNVRIVPNKAVVYVLRRGQGDLSGDRWIFFLANNSRALGPLIPNHYFKLLLDPGAYDLQAIFLLRRGTEGGTRLEDARSFTFIGSFKTIYSFDSGRVYFINTAYDSKRPHNLGFLVPENLIKFEMLDETEGRNILSVSKLVTRWADIPLNKMMQAMETGQHKSLMHEQTSIVAGTGVQLKQNDALESLKKYDILSPTLFTSVFPPDLNGNYRFAELFASARPQMKPKLENATLDQLRRFRMLYGNLLGDSDRTMVMQLLIERENEARSVPVTPQSEPKPKPVAKPKATARSTSPNAEAPPPKEVSPPKPEQAPNPF